MSVKRLFVVALCLAGWVTVDACAQDVGHGQVWGVGIALIPATSFEVDEFSFPTFTISLRYWSGAFGAEGALTFAVKTPTAELPEKNLQATFQFKGLYKFAHTPETDFYLSSGVVARYHFDRFLMPAIRFDAGAQFNENPNLATSLEFGYGFRLLGEGDFLDRITTGVGWGRHFYPTPL